jgi:dTDP-4-amino-4,6-dideoxygalactose transaminase
MTARRIPFNRPYTTGREFELMADAIARGHLSGDGHYTRTATAALERLTSAPRVLLTTSCTHALEMSALLLDLRPGDEVLMPSFTFVSTANAFALRGATPVFVDIRRDTFNIDECAIEAAITARTRAIVVVHYAGVACEMDEITRIGAARGIPVIEDDAHGFGATYRGRPLGSFGALATLSFHETKNIHCGEGGALLINDPQMDDRAEILREKGTNRSRFFRGQVDKYTWIDIGSSYLPSDLLAAFLCAQLDEFDDIQARRLTIWDRYRAELAEWAGANGFTMQTVPPHCHHPAHLFALLAPDLAMRTRFIEHMSDSGVHVVFHYVPLHSAPKGVDLTGDVGELPVTDQVSERLVRLPLYPGLTAPDVDAVVAAARRFRA